MKYQGKTIVIVGPTGSGKTGVAVEIAKRVNGEIISADSRAIFRGMDIGTAKPTMEEREGVPHYGLDLVEPGERFTVADWKKEAEQKICSIRERGKVPIVVGGTGLYVDALVFNYSFDENTKFKREGKAQGTGALAKDRAEMSDEYLVVGIEWPMDKLRERLARRIDLMFDEGLYEETRRLAERFGWETQAMKSDVYRYVWGYLQGEYNFDEAKRLATTCDYHLAKRQMTWFKRNNKIIWLPLEQIFDFVLKCIQDE